MSSTSVTVNGIEVQLGPRGEVRYEDSVLGRVGREQRLGQWFWRAYDAESGEPYKRFLTSRPEAILLLLLHAGIVEGIGF